MANVVSKDGAKKAPNHGTVRHSCLCDDALDDYISYPNRKSMAQDFVVQ